MKNLLLISILMSASSVLADNQDLINEMARDAAVNALAYNEIIKHIESGNISEAKISACGWLDTRLLILNHVKENASEHAKTTVEKAIRHIASAKHSCNFAKEAPNAE